MSQLNPYALTFWIVGASIGYAVDGGHGLSIGVAITAGLTLIGSILIK